VILFFFWPIPALPFRMKEIFHVFLFLFLPW
jgi:hypothetical protein